MAVAVRYDAPVVRRSVAMLLLGCGCLIDNPAWLGPPGATEPDDTGETTDGSEGVPVVGCSPRPAPSDDAITLGPEQVAELPERIAAAAPGTTILLADGTYELAAAAPLVVAVPGIVLRSASGNASAVVLDGGTASAAILEVRAPGIEIAELTLTGGTAGAITFAEAAHEGLVYGVRVVDVDGPAILGESDPAGESFVDRGEVACSSFIRTVPAPASTCTGMSALRVPGGEGWVVRNDLFEGYRCSDAVAAPPTVGLRDGARGSQVLRNVFRNCARPVLLGNEVAGGERSWPDLPCGLADGWGHVEGVIANNQIWVGDAAVTPDSMISAWNACDARIYHNTIVLLGDGFHGIEHRFDRTTVTIVNNLTNVDIAARDGSRAIEEGNLPGTSLDDFVDVFTGDLHLVPGAAAVDAGLASLGEIELGPDIDGDPRDARPDVGADELVQ